MSEFKIYPAIDIRDGKCVRLIQGDYNQETIYGDSPLEMARSFVKAGAKWIHMVDLDGAKAKKRINHEVVVQTAKELGVNVQIGGGIRTEEDIRYYLENGVTRVILGSVAVRDPLWTKEMLSKYGGDKIVIGLDAKEGMVQTNGWLEASDIRAEDLGRELATYGAKYFIYTDISRDGMLNGPNVEEIVGLALATGREVIASGGVSNVADVEALRAWNSAGVAGVIIGKALYTNQFTLEEVLACEVK